MPSHGGKKVAAAMSFTEVDQDSPLGTEVTSGSGSSTGEVLASIDIPSAPGELLVSALTAHLFPTATPDAEQIEHWNATGPGGSFRNIRGAGATKFGAASVNMSWTLSPPGS